MVENNIMEPSIKPFSFKESRIVFIFKKSGTNIVNETVNFVFDFLL